MFAKLQRELAGRIFNVKLIALLVLAFQMGGFAQKKAESVSKQPSILVVGTYHFANQGEGFLNVKSHDILTPQRQKEIEQLIDLLAVYKPTKIAIESPYGNEKLSDEFTAYLTDESRFKERRNEIYQLDFRLAKRMKHTQIYPVDWRNAFDITATMNFATANSQIAVLQNGITRASVSLGKLKKMMDAASVTDIFRFLNGRAEIREQQMIYLNTLVQIGKDTNYVGTDVLADWYERNLKMFSNLTRISNKEHDRILFIVGSGHVYLLEQFARESELFKVESAMKYLKR